MSRRARYRLTLALVALGVAACGTAGAPAATAPGGGATPRATSPAAETSAPTADAATGPTSAPVSGTAPKACDLLTDEDIRELGAVEVVKKEDDVLDTIYANHCRWTLEAGEINLGIVSPGGRDFYETRLGIVNGLVPVEGLPADIAMLQELTGTIWAVKDDTLIDMFTIAVGAPDEELVRRVIANLDR